MIVFIDGLSGLGKTTLIKNLLNDNPDWTVFKGLGAVNVAFKEQGQQYNFAKHQIMSRFDECNGFNKVILWDRGLSEPIYSKDPFYVSEITRVIRSHYKAIAILLTTESPTEYAQILNDKDTSGFTHKEGNLFGERWEKYNKVVSGMNHCRVNLTTDQHYPSNDNYEMIQQFIEDKLVNMESRSNYRNG
jgi:hypothetical protein